MTDAEWTSTGKLARRWECGRDVPLRLAKQGLLEVIDISKPGAKRPKYRISLRSVKAFEEARRVAPEPKPQARRRPSRAPKQFF